MLKNCNLISKGFQYVEKGKWTSVRELFNNRVHLGHRIGSLDQRMTRYIWGQRLEHLIIDLDKTLVCLNKALEVTREIAKRQGIILFVTNSPSSSIQVENAAAQVGEYAHTRPWRQGTLTNSLMIFGAVTRLPDLIISIGSHQALLEAAKMSIPSIAIMDSDCNPNIVTYPIPGNDDTPSAVQLYLSLFTKAISIGKEQQKK